VTQSVVPRAEALIHQWNVSVEETRVTNTSVVVFGRRGNDPVVLKVLREPNDEWLSGKVLQAFNGNGVARVYEFTEGAVLLERLVPGNSPIDLVLAGHDVKATRILANVMGKMSASECTDVVMAEDWASGFDRCLAGRDHTIPLDLVKEARGIYLDLCTSQQERRLLHGDLHHENVLFDNSRGWLAIDPKGVIGETEFEISAALLNPIAHAEFATEAIVRQRIDIFQTALNIESLRILRWAFARAVLSAVWSWEDKESDETTRHALLLAQTTRSILRLL
jgi:streptomycin 6-kinase